MFLACVLLSVSLHCALTAELASLYCLWTHRKIGMKWIRSVFRIPTRICLLEFIRRKREGFGNFGTLSREEIKRLCFVFSLITVLVTFAFLVFNCPSLFLDYISEEPAELYGLVPLWLYVFSPMHVGYYVRNSSIIQHCKTSVAEASVAEDKHHEKDDLDDTDETDDKDNKDKKHSSKALWTKIETKKTPPSKQEESEFCHSQSFLKEIGDPSEKRKKRRGAKEIKYVGETERLRVAEVKRQLIAALLKNKDYREKRTGDKEIKYVRETEKLTVAEEKIPVMVAILGSYPLNLLYTGLGGVLEEVIYRSWVPSGNESKNFFTSFPFLALLSSGLFSWGHERPKRVFVFFLGLILSCAAKRALSLACILHFLWNVSICLRSENAHRFDVTILLGVLLILAFFS